MNLSPTGAVLTVFVPLKCDAVAELRWILGRTLPRVGQRVFLGYKMKPISHIYCRINVHLKKCFHRTLWAILIFLYSEYLFSNGKDGHFRVHLIDSVCYRFEFLELLDRIGHLLICDCSFPAFCTLGYKFWP